MDFQLLPYSSFDESKQYNDVHDGIIDFHGIIQIWFFRVVILFAFVPTRNTSKYMKATQKYIL